MRNPYLIIIGCGRSGTKYTARLLKRSGLRFGHERVLADGTANWYFTARNGAKNPPFGHSWRTFKELKRKPHFLHQVRTPLKVIGSACALTDKSWTWICKHLQIEPSESKLSKAMKYWYSWNCKAQKIAQLTYKVEEISSMFVYFSSFYRDASLKDRLQQNFDAIPTHVNTRKRSSTYRKFTWNDLYKENTELTEKIIRLANVFGYSSKELGI